MMIIKRLMEKKLVILKKLFLILKTNANKKLNFLIERNGSTINLNIIPKAVINANGEEIGIIGVQFTRERKKLNFFQSI